MTTMTNRETVLASLDAEMAKLGGQSVNIARPKLALTLVSAAARGDIDESDVEARYDAYLAGRTKAQAKSDLAKGVDDGNGKKANVSKCRQLVRCAMLPEIDAVDLMDRAVTVRGNLIGGDDPVKAPFDAFVDVARAQIANPDAPLTDEQIEQAVRKPEKSEKSELEKLIGLYKSAKSLDDKLPGNVAFDRALDALAEAITEEGGQVPAVTKAEKEAAKEEAAALAYIARMGYRLAAE